MTLPDKIKHGLANMVKECNLSNVPEIVPTAIIGKNVGSELSLV